MKRALLIALIAFAPQLLAESVIPAGTILPVELNSSLQSQKSRSGQLITGRIMQDVPLPNGNKIHAGSKVIGHVLDAKPAGKGAGGQISLRFDTLIAGGQRIPLTANLRALASMMNVSEAQVPETGPDRGTSEYSWTTDQIGGEIDYRGEAVFHGAHMVGNPVADGVLAPVSSQRGTKCRGAVQGNHESQALWVFSSDACGLYGFPDVTLTHAGRTEPVGAIILQSNKGDLKIRAGSGMLLRVDNKNPAR
jgi:hypothetical protein